MHLTGFTWANISTISKIVLIIAVCVSKEKALLLKQPASDLNLWTFANFFYRRVDL